MTILTEEQAAEYLGLSTATLRKGRRNRPQILRGPPYLRFGRAIRYAKEHIDTWITEQRIENIYTKKEKTCRR
jgi:predicted DNA-binding transcriptional regulator AlpA